MSIKYPASRLLPWITGLFLLACVLNLTGLSGKSQTADSTTSQEKAGVPGGIAWYGVLEDGIAEAQATHRPIFLMSAAPQCAGIPGMW